MRCANRRVAAAAIAVALVAAGDASAQNRPKPGDPPYEPAPLILPAVAPAALGARSLGMGRAFIALADDATASVTNPAGLAFLTRPQLSLHGRVGRDEQQSLLAGGAWAAATADEMRARASADPAFGLSSPLPPLAVDARSAFEEDALRPAFAAGVWPMRRATLSAFLEQSRQLSGGGSVELFEPFFADRYRSDTQLELSVWSLGVGAATTIGERWRVGAALRGTRYELAAFDSYRLDDWSDHEFESDPPTFDHVDIDLTRTAVDDSDLILGLTLGAVVEPREDWSVGLVYRQGGRASFETRIEQIRCTDVPGQGTCVIDDPASWVVTERDGRLAASIPDTFGVGVAWWVDDPLVIALDVTRDDYGRVEPDVAGAIGDRFRAALEPPGEATRVHLGAEYEVGAGRRSAPLYVRAGLFTEPDRDGSRGIDSDRVFVTLGAGVVWHTLQFDGAVQLGDGIGRALLSIEYRFR